MTSKILLVCAFVLVGVVNVASAQDLLPRDNGILGYHEEPRYRSSESHPLRVVAYALHPVGWVLREGIFRPLSALFGSTAITRSVFGFREPFDYREPLCFDASGAVPDCRQIPPLSMIGSMGAPLVDGDGGMDGGLVSERQVFFPDIAFDFDKGSLNHLGQGRVRQVAQLLASVPSLNVVVEGHADPRGSDEYNQELGMSRAKTVINELVELGIDPARLSAVSYGEARPIFSEDTEWAWAVNRRAQFTVGTGEEG